MKPTTLLLLAALIAAPYCSLAQSKIDSSKKSLTESEGVNYKKTASSSSSSSDDDGEGSFIIQQIVVPLFSYTIGAVFKYGLIGDYRNEEHLYNGLTWHPYYYPKTGNFVKVDTVAGRQYVFRIDVKDKLLYSDNNLFGNHLEAKIRPHHAFYLKADYKHIFERNKWERTNNDLAVMNISFAYDRVRLERFNLGWSAGYTHMFSGVNKGGVNLGLNAEYFLKKDISFMGAAELAFVNNKLITTYELESRWYRKNHFITAGFEQIKIAGPKYNFVTLGGGIYF